MNLMFSLDLVASFLEERGQPDLAKLVDYATYRLALDNGQVKPTNTTIEVEKEDEKEEESKGHSDDPTDASPTFAASVHVLDQMAAELEAKGHLELAAQVDKITNEILSHAVHPIPVTHRPVIPTETPVEVDLIPTEPAMPMGLQAVLGECLSGIDHEINLVPHDGRQMYKLMMANPSPKQVNSLLQQLQLDGHETSMGKRLGHTVEIYIVPS